MFDATVVLNAGEYNTKPPSNDITMRYLCKCGGFSVHITTCQVITVEIPTRASGSASGGALGGAPYNVSYFPFYFAPNVRGETSPSQTHVVFKDLVV